MISTPFLVWQEASQTLREKQGVCIIIRKWKPTEELKEFYKYASHILKPQNTEIGEPEFNNIGEKSKDKNELIIHNPIINARWNQISDMMQEFIYIFQDN